MAKYAVVNCYAKTPLIPLPSVKGSATIQKIRNSIKIQSTKKKRAREK
jgi:hypothetical protein